MGADTSSMSVFMGLEKFQAYLGYPSSAQQGLMAAANPAGALFGCLLAGKLSEKVGFVWTFRLAALNWVIGSVVSFLVVDLVTVCAGRALKGVSVGFFAAHLPPYVSCVIPPVKKGLTLSIVQMSLTSGILAMYLIGCFCSLLSGTLYFRVAWAVEGLPGLILLGFCNWLPESPKWLVLRKKWKEAYAVLISFRKDEDTETEAFGGDVEKAIDMYANSFDKNVKCKYLDLFKKPLFKHTLSGVFIQTAIQMTGINVLMYFLIFVCEMAGLEGTAKTTAAAMQYVINVLFTLVPIAVLDRMRRIDILVTGFFLVGLCLVGVGGTMGWKGHAVQPVQGNPAVQWEVRGSGGSAVLALCYMFIAIFASTLACGAWVYTEEIFPSYAKSKGLALCISTSWLMTTALTFVGPLMLQYLKWGTFVVFGSFCLVCCVLICLWLPETHRVSDEDVKTLFYPANPLENKPQFIVAENMSRPSTAPSVAHLMARIDQHDQGSSPFFREHETSSLFGATPVNLVSPDKQPSPFKPIDDGNSSFKVNRSG